jgi:hypothetical protein
MHTKFWSKMGRIRPFERLRHRWEDSIKLHCNEIRCEAVDWIYMVQDRD